MMGFLEKVDVILDEDTLLELLTASYDAVVVGKALAMTFLSALETVQNCQKVGSHPGATLRCFSCH